MKQLFAGLAIAFIFVMTVQAAQESFNTESILKIINSCYESENKENKMKSELGKCVLGKLKNVANPHAYRLYMYEKPSKTIEKPVVLIIYDKYGQVLICKGTATEKIVFKECHIKQIPNFTPEKYMHIIPEL